MINPTQIQGSAFRQSHPVNFALFDKDNHYALYIDDSNNIGEPLNFEVINSSDRAIVFQIQETETASVLNHHFELRFRAGVLSANTLNILQDKSKWGHLFDTDTDRWDLFTAGVADGADFVSIFILYKGEATWDPNTTHLLQFKGINADAAGGARGTQVACLTNMLTYAGDPEPINTRRTHHMSIINHRGAKNIPLHVGFKGSNQVVNVDGVTNELTLQMVNNLRLAQTHADIPTITFNAASDAQPASRLVLETDVQIEGEAQDWALARASEFNDVAVTAHVIRRGQRTVDSGAILHVKPVVAGQAPSRQWEIVPQSQVVLNPLDTIEIRLTGIVTSLPTGPANLYLHYDNIEGYQDGLFTLQAMKSPIRFLTGVVGSQTPNEPQASVDIHADIRAGNSDLYFTKTDHNHTGIGNTPGHAAIENAASHNTLMIMGRSGTNKGRKVSIWDYLEVNGNMSVNGSMTVVSTLATTGRVYAGNSDLYFTKADHNHTGIGNTAGHAAIENAANYNTLMILGRSGTDKGRKVSIWDYLEVNGSMNVTGSMTVVSTLATTGRVYAGNSDLYFTKANHNHTGIGNTAGHAAIENAANYNTLMILGRYGTDKGRKVSIWDYLEVNGSMNVTGNLRIAGNIFKKGRGWWYLKLDEPVQGGRNTPLIIGTNTSWEMESDGRLKQQIKPLKNALQKVSQLNGVTYKWNQDGLIHLTRGIDTTVYASPDATEEENRKARAAARQQAFELLDRQEVGLIAQDVEKVLPQLVHTGEAGYKSIRYDLVTALLVEAIKELREIVSMNESKK
jgi:hypothetical protein